MSADPRFASAHGQVRVDLAALRHNVRRLRELVGADGTAPALMVVVKADGYGHGILQSAAAARVAGAEWLGVATAAEALALRAAGDTGPLLCWLAAPGFDFTDVVAAGIDVAAYSVPQLLAIAGVPGRARVHLKLDTGLTRGGAARADWAALFAEAARAEQAGEITVVGVWSHLACADEPEHPATARQRELFEEGLAQAARAGLTPQLRHLANSAGALLHPGTRYDLVRLGIASYGLSPAPEVASSAALGLRPAMTVSGTVVITKDVAPGSGVSYGHRFVADHAMRAAVVPMGYGDGVPRHASNRAEVQLAGARRPILGRVCMDQFVVEAGDAVAGDEVVLFGPGDRGEPTAQDWAEACETISYEILTRMGGRQVRSWVDSEAPRADEA